jgi:drug/metabolite transporter (DMT)-like permease
MIGPWGLACTRSIFTALIFYILYRLLGTGDEPPLKKDWKAILFMTITGVAGYQVLFYYGLHFTTGINAALIHGITPLATIAMAWFFLRSPFNGAQIVGGVLSVVGIAIIMSSGDLSNLTELRLNFGDLLLTFGVLMFAGYAVVARQVMPARSVLSATALMTYFSVILLLPGGIFEVITEPPELNWSLVAGIAYVIIFPGVVAFLAWNYGVKELGPTETMVFMNMTPVYVVIFSTYFLNETLTGSQLSGGLLVIAGCLFAALVPEILKRTTSTKLES